MQVGHAGPGAGFQRHARRAFHDGAIPSQLEPRHLRAIRGRADGDAPGTVKGSVSEAAQGFHLNIAQHTRARQRAVDRQLGAHLSRRLIALTRQPRQHRGVGARQLNIQSQLRIGGKAADLAGHLHQTSRRGDGELTDHGPIRPISELCFHSREFELFGSSRQISRRRPGRSREIIPAGAVPS